MLSTLYVLFSRVCSLDFGLFLGFLLGKILYGQVLQLSFSWLNIIIIGYEKQSQVGTYSTQKIGFIVLGLEMVTYGEGTIGMVILDRGQSALGLSLGMVLWPPPRHLILVCGTALHLSIHLRCHPVQAIQCKTVQVNQWFNYVVWYIEVKWFMYLFHYKQN